MADTSELAHNELQVPDTQSIFANVALRNEVLSEIQQFRGFRVS